MCREQALTSARCAVRRGPQLSHRPPTLLCPGLHAAARGLPVPPLPAGGGQRAGVHGPGRRPRGVAAADALDAGARRAGAPGQHGAGRRVAGGGVVLRCSRVNGCIAQDANPARMLYAVQTNLHQAPVLTLRGPPADAPVRCAREAGGSQARRGRARAQAFIKWGQWAATRPDLFPGDLCAELARLHTGAPRHGRSPSCSTSLTRRPSPAAASRRCTARCSARAARPARATRPVRAPARASKAPGQGPQTGSAVSWGGRSGGAARGVVLRSARST